MKRIVCALRHSFAVIVLSAIPLLTAVAQQAVVDLEEVEAVVEEAAKDVEVAVAAEDLEWAVAVADKQTLKLRAKVQVERALVRRACLLTADQEKALEQLDDRWVDKVIEGTTAQAIPDVQPGLIRRFFGVNVAAAPRADPTVTLKQKLETRIDELLTDQQKRRYNAEKASREEFRVEATAVVIVETLYERLGLTDRQGEAIQQAIQPWVAKTNIQMLVYFSNPQYCPNVPEHLLKSYLSQQQLKIYRGLNRQLFTNENFNDGQAPIVIER